MTMMGMETIGSPSLWLGFVGFVLAMLALDLGVFHRKAHEVSLKEAAAWSAVWVGLAGIFAAGVWAFYGSERALEFTTGFVIEKALAVDNIFVFVIIFSAFSIPLVYQHRVLFWGILGALVMRAAFIVAGGAFLQRFHWAIYVFGGVLLLTGIKLFIQRDTKIDPQRNVLVRGLRRVLPISPQLDGAHFFTKLPTGRWAATPLLLALAAVEFTDVVFAVDSIPAIFAVTQDPFIVFTSNIFAILGLRSLYFLLAGVVERFHLLKPALALVLVFVGAKMLLVEVYKVPTFVSLLVIGAMVGGAMVLSWLGERRTRSLSTVSPTRGADARA